MNHQSDYGYAIGELEHRSRELCLQRAANCRTMATLDPSRREQYLQWAIEWSKEALTAYEAPR